MRPILDHLRARWRPDGKVGGLGALLLVGALAGCGDPSPPDGDATAPTGHTRVAFISEGVPRVLDLPERRLLRAHPDPIASGAFSASLSRDGRVLGLCARTPDRVYGGPVGALSLVAEPDLFCIDVVPLPDGTGLAWLEQTGLDDHVLHVVDLLGASLTDATVRGMSLWAPVFSPDGQHLYAVRGEGSNVGPLVRIDWQVGTVEPVTTGSYLSPFDVAPDGRIAAASALSLYLIDPVAGTEEAATSFPVEPPGCQPRSPGSAPGCYLEVHTPAFSPDGVRVAFMARGSPNLTDDDEGDIFVYDASDGSLTRLTDDEVSDASPRFDGLGEQVIWLRRACAGDDDPACTSLVRAPADGTGGIETLVTGDVSEPRVAWPRQPWPAP